MASEIIDAMDRLYSHFFLRDLKYVFIGAVPLGFLVYVHTLQGDTDKFLALKVLAFIVVAYFLGLIVFHAGVPWAVQIYPHGAESFEKQERQNIVMMDRIYSHANNATVRQLERTSYIKEVHGGAAVAILVLAVLLVVYRVWGHTSVSVTWPELLGIEIALSILIWIGIRTNRSKAKIEADTVKELYEIIGKTE